jgi:hypothetical protein
MRNVRLLTDYECHPLWEEFSDGIANIAPSSLPISKDLTTNLDAWSDVFDGTLNQEDPASSGFSSDEALIEFNLEGERLSQCLKRELGESYSISYFKTTS